MVKLDNCLTKITLIVYFFMNKRAYVQAISSLGSASHVDGRGSIPGKTSLTRALWYSRSSSRDLECQSQTTVNRKPPPIYRFAPHAPVTLKLGLIHSGCFIADDSYIRREIASSCQQSADRKPSPTPDKRIPLLSFSTHHVTV